MTETTTAPHGDDDTVVQMLCLRNDELEAEKEALIEELERAKEERDEAYATGKQVFDELRRVEAERDALAAHVERARPMVEAYRGQLGGALWAMDDEEAGYAKDAEGWLSSNPTSSLTRLKAEWAQVGARAAAQAIRMDYEGAIHADDIADFVDEIADDYRHQAGGGE